MAAWPRRCRTEVHTSGGAVQIGLIVPPWQPVPPRAYGAIETVVHDLAVALDDAGHTIVLVTTGDSTCPVTRVATYERSLPEATGTASVELVHVLDAYEALRDVDLVHDHTISGPLVGRQGFGAQVVTTAHWTFTGHLRRLYATMARLLPVVAVSHAQARLAPDVAVVRVIHHGVDGSSLPVGRGEGGYLVLLARMHPDKGVHLAVEVARRAGARLVLAGPVQTATEQDYFASQVRPLLGAGVEYVGEIGGRDKHRLLGSAQALLMPVTWEEPFGLVAIEALGCGTPVLAFSRGALPEIVQHGRTGFLCDTTTEMASAVQRLGELDRRECRKEVEGRFSARRMAAEHVALYEHVLNAGLSRCAGTP
jgi:glycosyltransferase involved in cell wall biosynthesis